MSSFFPPLKDELPIDTLLQAFYSVLRFNPGIFAWILQEGTEQHLSNEQEAGGVKHKSLKAAAWQENDHSNIQPNATAQFFSIPPSAATAEGPGLKDTDFW